MTWAFFLLFLKYLVYTGSFFQTVPRARGTLLCGPKLGPQSTELGGICGLLGLFKGVLHQQVVQKISSGGGAVAVCFFLPCYFHHSLRIVGAKPNSVCLLILVLLSTHKGRGWGPPDMEQQPSKKLKSRSNIIATTTTMRLNLPNQNTR